MYLKSLEIQGFKSFPDKTLLEFSAGISTVVGSNIVDAIRWVLGEQSTKTLRGGKMQDVIFGGTLRRPPQGYCEVSLTLDNGDRALDLDYAEVTVTRRYYRSGDSEFFINRRSVRLKDIHELFMDTGLGRDGYSIIGQGRIDEILSVKSADRREIFEEAAGISKFRYRKEESERRLETAEENLVRIRDIVTELEGQVGPLKVQAEKARSFLLLRDRLRTLEVSVWLMGLEGLKESLARVQTDFDNAERLLSARRGELDELYARAEALAAEMQDKDRQSERVRGEIREAEGRAAEVQSDIAVCRANLKSNEENIAAQMRELSDSEGRARSLQAQQAERRTRMAELEKRAEGLQRELDGILEQARAAASESAGLSERIDGLRTRITLEKQAAQQGALERAGLQSGALELRARAQNIGREKQEAAARLRGEEQRACEIAARIGESEEKKAAADNMLRGYALRCESRAKKAEELGQSVERMTRERNARADRLGLLQAMEREYEGFSHAVKKVMAAKHSGALAGIHGPVSCLITVRDDVAVAVEIALGAAMQNVVTDDEQSAKRAIGYLKAGEHGRATFLPLTAVKPRRGARRELAGSPGFLGYADDLTGCDERYRALVGSLLAGTAVVDHIDNAVALAKRTGYGVRIVTLDGQLIQTSGAMTGGSLNKNVGALSRKNELERLKNEIAAMEETIGQERHRLAEARRELEKAQYESGVAEEEKRAAEDALLSARAEQSQHGALLDSMRARLAGLQKEEEGLSARFEEIAARDAAMAEAEKEHLSRAQELQTALDELTGGVEAAEGERGRLGDLATEARTALATTQTEHSALREALRQLEELMEALSGDRRTKEEAVAAIRAQNESLRQALRDREADLAQCRGGLEQKNRLLKSVTEERLRLEGQKQKCEKQSQSKNAELLNLERERARLENKKTQVEMEESQLLDRLWENYELTRTTAEEVRVPVESLAGANRQIGELRADIKKLGDVNIGAIEEYAKVSERYEFLSAQKEDLEKAKNDLLEVIGELTRNMQQIFARQFAAINDSFRDTFREIFGGGNAYLQLEDESDILNCGIEIKVELPGKSMRAISLLSGGEKAFVAIALYFAIIKVRPTPFCVLDEIEAALDDVNVLRYIQYMRRLTDKTQFIVITHRRGTMEGSDILYGVTMQEQGVSKLLALNLGEIEEKIKMKVM